MLGCLWADPAKAHSVVCSAEGLQSVVSKLKQAYKEKPVGLGTTQDGSLLVLTVTQDGDGWTLLLSKPSGQTCVIESGHNWEALKFGPVT